MRTTIERYNRMNVLRDWVQCLGLRHQGCLLTAIRGCDGLPKEDASKALVRCLRGVILKSYSEKPSSFIEYVGTDELNKRMIKVLLDHDHYPLHYIIHLAHCAEIIGYKWPDPDARSWQQFYLEFVKCLHLNPETEEQLDLRLNTPEG